MAKDPAFLFYPGDYLRDTQCLSEKSQVAYDRIMCEHMRNICISQQQLNFFIKRLDSEEKKEVMGLLIKVEGGFQIEWVAASISKRRSYSESRSKNRKGKPKNISKSYVPHMENEIENVNEIEIKGKRYELKEIGDLPEIKIGAAKTFLKIAKGIDKTDEEIVALWEAFKAQNVTGKKFYNSISDIETHFLNWLQLKKINGHSTFTSGGKQEGAEQLVSIIKQDFATRRKENS